jgi:hypothetical protein
MLYNMPEDILDQILELKNRLDKFEKIVQTGVSSIDNGALEVRQNGSPKVKVGKLDDGSYGIAMYDAGGVALPLSQLAFGLQAASVAGSQAVALNSWSAGGPDVNVNITTGRMIVIVSGSLHVTSDPFISPNWSPTTGAMSYTVIGPTGPASPPVPILPDQLRGIAVDLGSNSIRGDYMQGSFVYAHSGLTPGTYTVASRYNRIVVGAYPGLVDVQSRSIVVLPY